MLRNIYLLSILLTVGVISWIGFNVFLNMTQSTIPEDTSIQIVPITPTFDQATLKDLETRKRVDVDLSGNSPLPAQEITPDPEEEIPSELLTITPSPTISPSELEAETVESGLSPTPVSEELPQTDEVNGDQ